MTDILTLPPAGRLAAALKALPFMDAAEPVTLARAPGRLDVMGGIADYCGSLVCEMPLAVAAAAAVQRRNDGKLVCHSVQLGRTATLRIEDAADARQLREALAGEDAWARYLAGCVWGIQNAKPFSREAQRSAGRGSARSNIQGGDALRCAPRLNELSGGVTIVVDSDVPLGAGVSSSAAIEVATMAALAGMLEIEWEPMTLAAACQAVENRIVGAPCGIMDQVTSVMGREDAMLALLCQPNERDMPAQVMREVAVPTGYRFIGIHSGVAHEVKDDPYTDTRIAAFMGQAILAALAQRGEAPDDRGWLANRADDLPWFERIGRARLPERLVGQAFLDQYRQTLDPVTRIVPERVYHVRAATTHHIHEAQRVAAFVDDLIAAGSPEVDAATREAAIGAAGRRMEASHRSYSDNARLGHPMTDRLAEMARQLGPSRGFYGARITGGGCGGTVALLVRDDPDVFAAVEQLRERYTAESGRATLLFADSGPGAAEIGSITMRIATDEHG